MCAWRAKLAPSLPEHACLARAGSFLSSDADINSRTNLNLSFSMSSSSMSASSPVTHRLIKTYYALGRFRFSFAPAATRQVVIGRIFKFRIG